MKRIYKIIGGNCSRTLEQLNDLGSKGYDIASAKYDDKYGSDWTIIMVKKLKK
jgi:hypothetical protein